MALAPTVTLAAETLLSLNALVAPPPPKWKASLVSNTINASTQADCVHFRFEFVVVVNAESADLARAWQTIALVSDQLTIHEFVVVNQADADVHPDAHLVVAGNAHALFVCTPGSFRVNIAAQSPYASKSKSAVTLWLPRAGRTDVVFVVNNRDVQLTAEPSLGVLTAISAGHTTLTAAVPPTDSLAIRWTEAAVDAAPADDKAGVAVVKNEAAPVRLSVTVEQAHLFSVGEGMLLISSFFDYDIRNGSVSALQFTVDPRVRVLGVEGAHLARWEAATAATADPAVHVAFNRSVEGAYRLRVESEIDLGGTTVSFHCPMFAHRDAFVSRELGFIGVEARTNVEVDQAADPMGCVPIDIGELSAALRGGSTNPTLLAYKFLQPTYNLQLSVQRHGDVAVCVALVEAAALTITLTEQGQLMKRLILMVRNSSRQYLRVYLAAAEPEIWSTVVDNKAVKPATDGAALMIPLKRDGVESWRQGLFPVELLWVESMPGLGGRGDVGFKCPRIDLPINKLFVDTWLPNEYEYAEFAGDLRECSRFSASPPTGETGPELAQPMAALSLGKARMASVSNFAMNDDNDNGEEADGCVENVKSERMAMAKKGKRAAPMMMMASASNSLPPPSPMQMQSAWGGGGRGRAGVVPVRVAMVTSGRVFRFERLLVLPDEPSLTLAVAYKRKSAAAIRARA